MSEISDSDYESESDEYGYDTPDEETSSRERIRPRSRSRSRLDRREPSSNRERSATLNRPVSRRGARRHGRRQRQRQRRNRRNNQDDSWYFPDEHRANQNQDDNVDQTSRENILTENQAWVQSLINRQTQPSRPTLSPLTQGNNHHNHTIRWTGSNSTVTISQDRRVNVTNTHNAGTESDRNQNSDNEVVPPRQQTSRPVVRAPSQQSQRVPISSNPDVNFNLAQQLEDRNRALQQLTQVASQIQIAAAAAAANYAQFISTQNSITGGNAPHIWDNSQSLGLWDNRIDSDESDSMLNVSNSESRRSTRQQRRERPNQQSRRRARRQRDRRRNNPYLIRNRSSNEANRPRQQNSSHSRRLDEVVSINPSQDNINSSDRTLLPQTPSGTSSQNEQLPENQQIIRNASTTDDNDPYQRFDAAFRRQDERNDWRQRRRRRQDRGSRRQMENRRHDRRRPAQDRSNGSVRDEDSNQDVRASLIALAQRTAIPLPPPLPPPHWTPPPRHNDEWREAPALNQFVPTQLDNNARIESEFYDSEQENVVPLPPSYAADDEDLNDYYEDYAAQVEAILKSYIDPAEGNSNLGEFLRRATERGRVIVSRVRTRITKQYFRRGDFQVALSDFRNLNPEHARQVPGVGFTGTVNNMYRLTVKQHSSFGKPTFEIRPMNKKVRKKKVHVCYKIRYFSRRDHSAPPRPPPRNNRAPLVTNV